jgi:hypothetical protein
VKLVEELLIGRQVRLEPAADLFIARPGGDQPMANEDAAGGRVGHEHRPTGLEPAGPPAVWPEALPKRHVEAQKPSLGAIARRAGNPAPARS